QGLLRLREFTQMELEYFFNPSNPKHENFAAVSGVKMRIISDGQETAAEKTAGEFVSDGTIPNDIMAYFMARQVQFYLALGIPYGKFYFRKLGKGETPHYSGGNFDMEVETSYGNAETIGNAYRTDYDLSAHAKMSGNDLSVFVEEEKKKIVPHVVEPSMGSDRLFWCILEHSYRDKTEKKDWEWFDFPPSIAPFTVSVFPLMKKDGLAEKAREVTAMLRSRHIETMYSESGSIGRRYARADEIGTPYCLTVDYDTLDSKSDKFGTVTIRYRNDGGQERVKISELPALIEKNVAEARVNLKA
ncbi:MAG TPA: His/Gly/Thr/Pro-type tRNA ligase C-terminal domain-containing protein, partial [Candidatus Micrarchaeota archaeon]|nr:His/Gly/Thr/Pro-type tRNA ligase C-terminal domain-containing protein [Candidatus Micrarchaeota archaeon]